MKKIITLILTLFALLALTGCSHRHTIDTWSVDYKEHWHICTECGEQIDVSAHELGKNEICIICNAKVYINDNGNTAVTVYDAEGKVLYETVFDRNGNVIEDASPEE